jgi:hypothetical protein
LAGQWDDRSGLNAPSRADNGSVAEGSASGADRSAARSESQMSIKTEDWSNSQQELGHCDLTSGAESIVVRPEVRSTRRSKIHQMGKSSRVVAKLCDNSLTIFGFLGTKSRGHSRSG